MNRSCDVCEKSYEAKRANSRFCSPSCRKRNQRNPSPTETLTTPVQTDVVDMARTELESAGRLGTFHGQIVMSLARRMDDRLQTGSSAAALAKQLASAMEQALDGAVTVASPFDELRTRRDRKLAAG